MSSRVPHAATFVSVGTKLMGAMLFVVAVVTALAYAHVSHSEREQLLAAKEKASVVATELFVAGIAPTLGQKEDSSERIALLLNDPQIRYGGVWRLDGEKTELVAEKGTRVDLAPRAASFDGIVVDRRANAMIVDEAVVSTKGERLGIVRVVYSLESENAAIASATLRMLLTSLALIFGLGGVVIALTRQLITRPLGQLRSAVKKFEAGQPVTIELSSNDEVAALSRAFASMTEAIVTRETRISTGNRDMRRVLDNMADGMMTVSRQGRMSAERSRILDDWFGQPPASRDLFEYFAGFAPTTARMLKLGWLALDDDIMPVEVILEQMPKRFERGGIFFEIEVQPLWSGSVKEPTLEQLLVVVRDVTAATLQARAERGQREALTVFRKFLDDRLAFREFFAHGNRIVDGLDIEKEDRGALLRDVHTLKGNAALYGIESVADACHRAESRAIDGDGMPMAEDLDAIRGAWGRTRAIVEQIDRGAEERIELRYEEHEAHVIALEARHVDPRLVEQVRSWRNELASQRLGNVAEHAKSIARRLGKGETKIETSVQPSHLRLRPELWAPFWQVFAHVLRNTFDHGVELPSERANAKKKGNGRVGIELVAERDWVELRVSDDGRGIDWQRVAQRAQALGLATDTRADLEEALYADAVSTAEQVSDISGRGIGMGAIREVVRACGGSIAIDTQKGEGTTLRFRFPLEMLTAERIGSLAPRAA